MTKSPIIKMLLLLIFSNLLCADQFFSSRYTKSIPTIYIHFYFIYKRKVVYITIIFVFILQHLLLVLDLKLLLKIILLAFSNIVAEKYLSFRLSVQ